MVVKAEVSVKAPIDKAFKIFSDIPGTQKRLTAVTKIEVVSKQKSGSGTRWRETRKLYGKESTEEMWITDFEPPRMFALEAESHGTKFRTVYEFFENGDLTDVFMTFEGKPQAIGAKLAAGFSVLFKGATQKALQKDLDELKIACEKSK